MIAGPVCIALALATTGPPPASRAEAIAFVHVDVIPMDSERLLRDHTVVVRGDRKSQYQGIMDVLEVLGRVGIDNIGLAAEASK